MARDGLFDAMLSKAALARSLGIARQSLYYHPRRPTVDRHLRDAIEALMADHPAYGHRRIALHLGVNKKRILRVMQKYHLAPTILRRRKKPGKPAGFSPIPNRAGGQCPLAPNVIWAGDFTYLWFRGRYMYLATVIDTFTREIIGWQIGTHHTSRLVIDTLAESLRCRTHAPQYFHSDQGSEYASHRCIDWLVTHGIIPSHSPKGKPWVNGRQESFFSSFKFEFGKPMRFDSLEALIEGIGKYLHYYNTERIHSALKMSPRMFYEQHRRRQLGTDIDAGGV